MPPAVRCTGGPFAVAETLIGFAWVVHVVSMAPGDHSPVSWRPINVLHLTDVHSFVAGNRHERVDADYADLLSFLTHMHEQANRRGVDLFVVNTGDIVDVRLRSYDVVVMKRLMSDVRRALECQMQRE
eukprot:SAG31_NODE_3386_length_4331_cov_2.421786_2_plen_128_part_00